MKIIITGATGAFGGAMVRYFYERGHDVIAVGRSSNPPKELKNISSYIIADISQPFQLPQADVCIHAAALSDDKAKMNELYAPNILGTRNTLEAAKEVTTFIFVSSSSVYLPDANPLTEDIAGKQNNKKLSPYGLSKLQSEDVIHKFYTGNRCFILRPRAFYGKGDTQIIPRMLKLVNKDVFNRPGKMNIQLSLTNYENMGHAIECCIMSDLKGIHTYNVSDDKKYVMISILRQLFKTLFGTELKEKEIKIGLLKFLAFFRIKGFTPLLVRALTQNMVLDISKIKKELNYCPDKSFESSLDEIENWTTNIGGVEILQHVEKYSIWGDEIVLKNN